jgi:hypothetical protein
MLKPFLGGDEVNSHPQQLHYRFIINFSDLSFEEVERWPHLLEIVESKVKPERLSKSEDVANWPWWQFWRARKALYESIRPLSRVAVCSLHSLHHAIALVPRDQVFSHGLAVFAFEMLTAFAVLQSQAHETWARFFGSSLEDRLRYTPSDCFETFPFPPSWQSNPALESAGQTYYDYRAALMIQNNEGLTDTYNRFHDPEETSPHILQLRTLHAAMDRAVLEAYGWHDLAARATCEFQLDYEEPEDEKVDAPAKRKKKKPWRYKWPQELHDEVLARLLALNQQYAEAERLAGEAAQTGAAKPKGSKKSGKKTTAKTGSEKKHSKKSSSEQVSLIEDE